MVPAPDIYLVRFPCLTSLTLFLYQMTIRSDIMVSTESNVFFCQMTITPDILLFIECDKLHLVNITSFQWDEIFLLFLRLEQSRQWKGRQDDQGKGNTGFFLIMVLRI